MGWPEFPGVSSPLVDFDGALKVDIGVARGMASWAWSPVDSVDLPESDIGGWVGVVVEGVGVSSWLVWDDAFAACLVPTVFGAPGGDILHSLGGSTVAGWALAWRAVSSAAVSQSQS